MTRVKKISIIFSGYMSVANAGKLKAEMEDVLFSKSTKIELDVSNLDEIDVTIIQLLYAFCKEVGEEKSITFIGTISPVVKKCFYSCGLIPDENGDDNIILEAIKNIARITS